MTLNDLMMAVYMLTAFAQVTRQRFWFILLSGFAFLFHSFLSSFVSDPIYYFSCSLINASCVFAAYLIQPISKVVRKLQILMICLIILDAYGYLIWYLYFEPWSYNYFCTLVYAAMIYTTLECEHSHVGFASRYNLFRNIARNSDAIRIKNGGDK